jgi:hypothetical protein
MFSKCTSLTSIPTGLLPATTLGQYSYYTMFTGCTSLTTIPSDLLPATTLTGYCYNTMFFNCTSLVINTASSSGYSRTFRIPSAGTGTAGTYSLQNMFSGSAGTMNSTPVVNTTYYTKD